MAVTWDEGARARAQEKEATRHVRPTMTVPTHPGDFSLVEAITYAKKIAIWNIEEIMQKVQGEKNRKKIAGRPDPSVDPSDIKMRATEAGVLAEFERTLGRLVVLEQKLSVSQAKGKTSAERRERVIARVRAAAERDRAKQLSREH